ncbi:hypothetical protein KQX54_000857 [Cotesia glomerata]|uniref:Uncharacterized protein n=1 Tax=Cotesia glomerata TaxID=32391 RepID=A0AAV7J0T8_COTGL|nr:hypothetical protein KQX54_000857 [Cotesia glomerata]
MYIVCQASGQARQPAASCDANQPVNQQPALKHDTVTATGDSVDDAHTYCTAYAQQHKSEGEGWRDATEEANNSRNLRPIPTRTSSRISPPSLRVGSCELAVSVFVEFTSENEPSANRRAPFLHKENKYYSSCSLTLAFFLS